MEHAYSTNEPQGALDDALDAGLEAIRAKAIEGGIDEGDLYVVVIAHNKVMQSMGTGGYDDEDPEDRARVLNDLLLAVDNYSSLIGYPLSIMSVGSDGTTLYAGDPDGDPNAS